LRTNLWRVVSALLGERLSLKLLNDRTLGINHNILGLFLDRPQEVAVMSKSQGRRFQGVLAWKVKPPGRSPELESMRLKVLWRAWECHRFSVGNHFVLAKNSIIWAGLK
jgi:hypothetical protein